MQEPSSSADAITDAEQDAAAAAAAPVSEDYVAANSKLGSSASSASLTNGSRQSSGFRERCKYIPLRLELKDRRLLRLLEAALNVSEYTDKVCRLVIFAYLIYKDAESSPPVPIRTAVLASEVL